MEIACGSAYRAVANAWLWIVRPHGTFRRFFIASDPSREGEERDDPFVILAGFKETFATCARRGVVFVVMAVTRASRRAGRNVIVLMATRTNFSVFRDYAWSRIVPGVGVY